MRRRVKKLKKEEMHLTKYLSGSVKPDGDSKKFTTDAKKATDTVRASFRNDLFPHIAPQHEELAAHLRKFVRCRQSGCTYDPTPPETWHPG